MKKDVIYIGNFNSRIMDAQTQLILGNCRIFEELGFKTTLIGNTVSNDSSIYNLEDETVILDNGIICYNIPFHKSINEMINPNIQFKYVCDVFNIVGVENIALIICYGSIGFANQVTTLCSWARKNKVTIIDNRVDLSDLNHGSFFERIVKKIDRNLLYWTISNRMNGMIAVSQYIADRFRHAHRLYPIIVLPPLKDTYSLPHEIPEYEDNLKRIVYIGIPFPVDGRNVSESAYKDRLDLFIDLLLSCSNNNYRFDIYGISIDEYLRVISRHERQLGEFNTNIEFHGRINHNDALKIVSNADFSVVYRAKTQMTMAGFSTKFVESISCGTPVIMTDTSEYKKYVEKGAVAFFLDAGDIKSQRSELERILSLTKREIVDRKKQCYERRVFDYRNYIPNMKEFIEELGLLSE